MSTETITKIIRKRVESLEHDLQWRRLELDEKRQEVARDEQSVAYKEQELAECYAFLAEAGLATQHKDGTWTVKETNR